MSDAYRQRFGGISRLYGRSALAAFSRSHVAVIGIGGVGSWAAEALARSGVGTLTLMDLDDICLTNTNRQVHTLEDTIGRPKVSATAERLRKINPELSVIEVSAFYRENRADDLLSPSWSCLVDAIDSVRQKAHLLATARQRGIPVVTIGGAGGRTDPARIRTADLSQSTGDRLLMLVRKKLRSQYHFPRAGKGKFRIPCVFSDEPPRFPTPDGSVCHLRDPESPGGINCDTGLGSATHLTAAMAFFATGLVLDILRPS